MIEQKISDWLYFSRWLGSAFFVRCQATEVAKHRHFFRDTSIVPVRDPFGKSHLLENIPDDLENFLILKKRITMTGAGVRSGESIRILSRYEPFFQNSITLLTKAKKGLSAEAVFDFMLISDLSSEHVESALNKSMKTFQNYRVKKTALDAPTSEKLLRLFSLYRKGADVFGSLYAFIDWLSHPAYGLGNQVPQTLMDTITGLELITEELVRIEYGDLA